MNSDKTDLMRFKQVLAIFTLICKPLHLEGLFTFLGSNISFTESDVKICMIKAWTAIDRFTMKCKNHLIDKIKKEFFQSVSITVLLYGDTT